MASQQQTNNNDDFDLQSLFNVKGKVALVTGGGSGIGLMITQALARNGAKVYIVGRTKEKLDTVVETHSKGASGQIIPIAADVTKKKDISQLYEQISSKEKHLDFLVNNAGIMSKNVVTIEAKSADEMKKNLFEHENNDFDDWDDIYRTNCSSCYFMSMCFLPLLEKASHHQKGWSAGIINICSISGQVQIMQHHPQYNASKAAVIHLTRMMAKEISNNGIKIRTNSIAPGVFPSEMTAGDSGADQKSSLPKDKMEGKIPAGRPGTDRDMASCFMFLATNTYMNGQTVTVDGGYTLSVGK